MHDLPPLQKQMSMTSLIYFKFGFEPYEITNHDCSTHTNTIHPLLTAGPIGVTVNLNTTYDICGTCSTKVKFELSACERLGKNYFTFITIANQKYSYSIVGYLFKKVQFCEIKFNFGTDC